MKLTDGERLIVVMLAEVMQELKINREIDPALVKTLAINNDDWAIQHKYNGIFHGEGPSDETVKETINILWMWGIIEDGVKALTGSEAAEAATWHYTEFSGFDGNNDRHYGIAHTLINDLGEFAQFAGSPLNSHSRASLPRYRAIYEKFDKYLNAGKLAPPSVEVLRDLCN